MTFLARDLKPVRVRDSHTLQYFDDRDLPCNIYQVHLENGPLYFLYTVILVVLISFATGLLLHEEKIGLRALISRKFQV